MPPATGRPRSTAADAAILAAATDVLREVGYAGLTIELVARRAGVARTTVYRRWPSADHLVVAAVAGLQEQVPLPDTGDVRADLVAIARGMVRAQTSPEIAAVAAELVAAVARAPELAGPVRALWARRRAAAFAVLERAVADGVLPASARPDLIVDQVAGPIWYRLLVTGDPMDDAYADDLVDAALAAARVPAPTSEEP